MLLVITLNQSRHCYIQMITNNILYSVIFSNNKLSSLDSGLLLNKADLWKLLNYLLP